MSEQVVDNPQRARFELEVDGHLAEPRLAPFHASGIDCPEFRDNP